jgi:hypothetical protein
VEVVPLLVVVVGVVVPVVVPAVLTLEPRSVPGERLRL